MKDQNVGRVIGVIVVLGLIAQGALMALVESFSSGPHLGTALGFAVYAVVAVALLSFDYGKTALVVVYVGGPLFLFLQPTLFARRANWEEEVTIAPGETVIVERGARFGSVGAIGSPKYTYPTRQWLRVGLASGVTAEWESALKTAGVGPSTLRPIYLHRDENRQLFLVTSFHFCRTWVDTGRPSPPYLAFRWTGEAWMAESVPTQFWGRSANLLVAPGPNTGLRRTEMEIQKGNQYAFEYDATLVNVPIVPNCGMYALQDPSQREK